MNTFTYIYAYVYVYNPKYIFGEIVSIMQNFDLTSASFKARREIVPPSGRWI